MKDQYFNGVFVPSACVFCKYHPMNATKTICTQPTDVQQLKAEIAALLSKYDVPDGVKIVPPSLGYLINELRQLSAV
jgi:hypothetical protein